MVCIVTTSVLAYPLPGLFITIVFSVIDFDATVKSIVKPVPVPPIHSTPVYTPFVLSGVPAVKVKVSTAFFGLITSVVYKLCDNPKNSIFGVLATLKAIGYSLLTLLNI